MKNIKKISQINLIWDIDDLPIKFPPKIRGTYEKIYLKNDVSLDVIAERLNTTRHNASQVINEHFGLNFFDLINKYRIQDAVEILQNDTSRTIIDVAYQVGFNNKVTFNKSFKRFLSQTPTQYLGSL